MRRLCADVTGEPVTGPTPLYCDNRAAELWTRNPQHFARQQHIDRCDLSVREQVLEFKTVTVHLVPTHLQLAGCFTKSLALPAFRRDFEKWMEYQPTAMESTSSEEGSSMHAFGGSTNVNAVVY